MKEERAIIMASSWMQLVAVLWKTGQQKRFSLLSKPYALAIMLIAQSHIYLQVFWLKYCYRLHLWLF